MSKSPVSEWICVRRSGICGGIYGLVLFGDGRASQRKQKVDEVGFLIMVGLSSKGGPDSF